MKFAEHLSAHITPEWRKQYICYEAMKNMLYKALEDAPSLEITDMFVVEAYYGRFADEFFLFCEKELDKVNNFFLEKLAEATRKFSNLEADLACMSEIKLRYERKLSKIGTIIRKRYFSWGSDNLNNNNNNNVEDPTGNNNNNYIESPPTSPTKVRKSMREVKLAFSEFYLSLVLLQNYQTLNFQGFRKIAKKHDKLTKSNRGTHWRQTKVEVSPFYTCKDVDRMIKQVETVFTDHLEGGDRQRAMKKLRVPPLGGRVNIWTTFRLGMYIGIFLVLITVTIYAGFKTPRPSPPSLSWRPALQMYRGFFLIILFLFLLGVNTYGWRSSGVNHVLIFELDPRDHLGHDQFFEVASFLAVIWTMSVMSYLLSHQVYIPAFSNPLSLLGIFLLYFFNPFPVMHFRARKWLLRVLFCIATAPFHHVGFADFWVADQLNSLSPILLDLEFLVCFYVSDIDWTNKMVKKGQNRQQLNSSSCDNITYGVRPLIACLPAWFRFAQCLRRYRDTRLIFPHIINAGKYATTFFVVLFSTLYRSYTVKQHPDHAPNHNVFFYLWMIAATTSSCYCLTWDLKMDWGLLDKNAGENLLLREEIVYPRKILYYIAIVENAMLRFSWVLMVYVEKSGTFDKEIVKTALACLEVFRRFVWNFFRLENEHLNNCGQFRAVRDISIVPINSDDQSLLIKMMDEEDGVTNRRKSSYRSVSSPADVGMGVDDDEDDEDGRGVTVTYMPSRSHMSLISSQEEIV